MTRLTAILVLLVGVGMLSAATAGAGAAATPKPTVDLLVASPNIVNSKGGSVVVRVKVEHAVRCAFRGQRLAFASLKLLRTIDCHRGDASLRIPIAANRYKHSVTLHFSVTASDTLKRSDVGNITVVEAAKVVAPKPAPVAPLAVTTVGIPSASLGLPYTATLTATGGTSPYNWTLASGTLPQGIALTGVGQLTGVPATPGQFPLSFQVADARGRTTTLSVTLSVADARVAPAPDAPTDKSTNWSGYGLTGGPFTSVSGTFNVPAITGSGSAQMSAAEWAGIDGFGPGASSIIQAGVDETYSPAFGNVTFPWYELYPAPSMSIPMSVSAGDEVTVAISEVSAGLWDLLVKDSTNAQSFDAQFSYGGADTTVEWIMEAPFSVASQSVIPLPPFTPVTFTNLAAAPTAQPATRFVMYQGGQPISTPSPLTANGFTVAYGNATPAAP
ncbi:MAG TPA: G1 family glutamic endopeptidase [Gaiellaceae bacterium]|nr:G1 family glutamic endopeptidase [Gaiellaceae bacterium]